MEWIDWGVNGLNQSCFFPTDLQDDPLLESLSSENTVVEKTAESSHNVATSDFCHGAKRDYDTDEDVSSGDVRSRKGSYTLEHPSPCLVAYMTKMGKQTYPTMETPR